MSQPYEMTDDTFEQMARVVAVSGELDMHAAPAFEQRLLACVSGDEPVILDLTEVAFMDSTAIGAMIATRKKANMTRGRFVLVCKAGDTRRMLHYTGLEAAFDIVDTREEALALLVSP